MKWVVIASFILYLARFSEGNALRCLRGIKNGCAIGNTEKVLVEKSHAECLSGSEWESSCHKCRCSDLGHAECTLLDACEKGEYEEPMVCKPNTKFNRDCNICRCLENGKGSYCTEKACLHFNQPVQSPELQEGFDCLPGSRWMSQCNNCTCSSDGHPTCTEKLCTGQDDETKFSCAPHTSWKIDCNKCSCAPNGRAYCTKMGCDMFDVTDFNPEVDEAEMPEHVLRTSNKKSVVCPANRMFIKDCNTCWCNEDGTSYFCTRRVCINEVPEPDVESVAKPEEAKRKCQPSEVFELDCNSCRCAVDGMSFSCTRKACVLEEEGKNVTLTRKVRATPQGTLKSCQPGQEFRMDCNKCLCNNEGQDYSCTRIDCSALNSNGNSGARTKREVATQLKTNCEPGTVFNQDCNTCRCTEDGNHATCTVKRCKEDKPDENELNLPESDPSFRCNPGEQFKKDCNDCTCSADGKSVFCTLRLCDVDISTTI